MVDLVVWVSICSAVPSTSHRVVVIHCKYDMHSVLTIDHYSFVFMKHLDTLHGLWLLTPAWKHVVRLLRRKLASLWLKYRLSW
jgi:hypothetical protein